MRYTIYIFFLISLCNCKPAPKKIVWYQQVISDKGLDKMYEQDTASHFYYLLSDFNGDKTEDAALYVMEKKTGKKGILIIHGKTFDYYIIGAGKNFGNGGNDFKWMDKWNLYNDSLATVTEFDEDDNIIGGKEIKLEHPGILVEKYEDGIPISGGIIYWAKGKYIWIQQGE